MLFFRCVLIAALILLVITPISCNQFNNRTCTQKEFINAVIQSKNLYTTDSLKIKREVVSFYKIHDSINQIHRTLTDSLISVDTIIYNSSHQKMSVLVTITFKNKSILPKETANYKERFEGKGFLAFKDSKDIRLAPGGPTFTDSPNKINLRRKMREFYFCQIGQIKNDPIMFYNFDDIRLWQSAIWLTLFK